MRQKLLLIVFLSGILSACVSNQDNISEDIKQEIKVTLEKLAVDNLKAWEPPFYEEKFLEFFTQRNDFSFAVDGFHVTNYEDWVGIVYESMEEDRKNCKEYSDVIHNIETEVINEDYGFVTIDYVWDYTTNEYIRYNVKSVVTMLFRNEDNNWKILNTHCSHGETQIVN